MVRNRPPCMIASGSRQKLLMSESVGGDFTDTRKRPSHPGSGLTHPSREICCAAAVDHIDRRADRCSRRPRPVMDATVPRWFETIDIGGTTDSNTIGRSTNALCGRRTFQPVPYVFVSFMYYHRADPDPFESSIPRRRSMCSNLGPAIQSICPSRERRRLQQPKRQQPFRYR